MCGILAILNAIEGSNKMRRRVVELSSRIRHRGPDWSGLFVQGKHYIAHERLAIVDPASGDQPLFCEDKTIVVAVNGEIYNHEKIRQDLSASKMAGGSVVGGRKDR